ncbi:MAG: hypothetical protein AAF485_33175, partial [Chloroflexota bacterium]
MTTPEPERPNPLGTTSLWLSITSILLVFAIGLIALVGGRQGWLRPFGTPLFLCGTTSAFLGFLAAVLGFSGLFGKNRPKAAAIVGFIL